MADSNNAARVILSLTSSHGSLKKIPDINKHIHIRRVCMMTPDNLQHHNFRFPFKYHGEQSVIRAENILIIMKSKQQVVGSLFEQVYQYNMISVFRKVTDGVTANVSRLRVIKRSELMRDVNQPEFRVDLQKLPLNCANKIILLADIGSQGN